MKPSRRGFFKFLAGGAAALLAPAAALAPALSPAVEKLRDYASFGDIVAATLGRSKIERPLVESLSSRNPMFERLKKNGRVIESASTSLERED